MPPSRIHPKLQGDIAEVAFLHKAVSLGLIVSKPYGDNAIFDFLTLGGRKLSRLQVKCTSCVSRLHDYRINSHWNCKRKLVPYTAEQIDFLAAYVQPLDAWYIFPPDVFAGRTHIIIPLPGGRKYGQYDNYRERWDLLFDPLPASGLSLHASADALLIPSPLPWPSATTLIWPCDRGFSPGTPQPRRGASS